jgi:hypothetical protein
MDLLQELKRVADAYRGQGYDVIVRPNPDQLPPFAKDFNVEIVGRRGAEGVLVAVRKNRDEVAADNDMQRYAEITGTQPGRTISRTLFGNASEGSTPAVLPRRCRRLPA